MDLSVIMPVKGRASQTAELIPRLIMTAGQATWELIVVVDEDPTVAAAVRAVNARNAERGLPLAKIIELPERQGYWKALAHGSAHARGDILGNIANDVLPGLNWAGRIVATFRRLYPDGMGIVAWNDGLLFDGHAGHLAIGRPLARRWYGDALWPTWYDHLWADVELCVRGMEENRYAVDLRAVLYHNHFILGQRTDDVYRYSHRYEDRDKEIYTQRRALNWPTENAWATTSSG